MLTLNEPEFIGMSLFICFFVYFFSHLFVYSFSHHITRCEFIYCFCRFVIYRFVWFSDLFLVFTDLLIFDFLASYLISCHFSFFFFLVSESRKAGKEMDLISWFLFWSVASAICARPVFWWFFSFDLSSRTALLLLCFIDLFISSREKNQTITAATTKWRGEFHFTVSSANQTLDFSDPSRNRVPDTFKRVSSVTGDPLRTAAFCDHPAGWRRQIRSYSRLVPSPPTVPPAGKRGPWPWELVWAAASRTSRESALSIL